MKIPKWRPQFEVALGFKIERTTQRAFSIRKLRSYIKTTAHNFINYSGRSKNASTLRVAQKLLLRMLS